MNIYIHRQRITIPRFQNAFTKWPVTAKPVPLRDIKNIRGSPWPILVGSSFNKSPVIASGDHPPKQLKTGDWWLPCGSENSLPQNPMIKKNMFSTKCLGWISHFVTQVSIVR